MTFNVVIHQHLYQPPREDPDFETIDAQPSAAPFHDWNQRIERECYRALVAARLPAADGRIARLVNTLAWTSFNVGPTLMEWLEREAPDTYRAIVAADRESAARLGTGNAIAQPYHHVILPLASRRDKVTEVRWGIADFKRRFGRDPLGMWAPETAIDDETLDVFAAEGIRFTVVAPGQVKQAPPHGLPGTYTTKHGRTIVVFPYHGDISHGIAFGGYVRDAHAWAAAMEKASGKAEEALVSVATDGETYGHHHPFGEMALAKVIDLLQARGARLENYGSLLMRSGVRHSAEIVAPSSWSCAHGVERWRSNCGCRSDGQRNPSQAWRTPLRDALVALGNAAHALFEREAATLLRDPWNARDAYAETLVPERARAQAAFLTQWSLQRVPAGEQRALELLEMERDVLRMMTSCAWFFDDVGGIEVQQVLRYAHRAMSLGGFDASVERDVVRILNTATSNEAVVGTGATVYARLRNPIAPAVRVAAAYAAATDHLVGESATTPRGFVAAQDGTRIRVTSSATRRSRTFEAQQVEHTGSHVAYAVTEAEGTSEPVRVELADFPEELRRAVRQRLRSQLLPRCLTPAELDELASGGVSLRGVVATALTRAISRLTGQNDHMELAHSTLDLFEQLETTVPFDAQTAFWRVWTTSHDVRASGEARRLGQRLGFALSEQV